MDEEGERERGNNNGVTERYRAQRAGKDEKERKRRVTPPLRFQHLYRSPSFAPFRPPLRPPLSLSRLASQHTLPLIMPVSLRPLSSHSLRLSATLTTEQPQESMHPGSLLPAANDPTFQAFSFSVSPPSSFSLPVPIFLSPPPLLLPPLSLYLSILIPLIWSTFLPVQSTRASASIRD